MSENYVCVNMANKKTFTHKNFKELNMSIPSEDGLEDVSISINVNECTITIEHYSSGQEKPYEKRKINW